MIDAGLKLEGEPVGEIAEGIGAAIGGPGVDAFKIEEKVTKYKLPLYAVIVKEDVGDAVIRELRFFVGLVEHDLGSRVVGGHARAGHDQLRDGRG